MRGRARRLASASLLVLALAACERAGDLAPVVNKGGTPPVDAAGTDSITVQKGDSAYIVARRHNVPLRDLIDANRLSPPYKLEAGQKLVLPSARNYVVQRGDTLYGISRMNNVDVSELTRLNNLTPPYAVQPGQTLRLPGPGSPGAGASTAVASAPDAATPTVTTLSEAPTTSATAPASNAGRGSRSAIQAAELAPPGGAAPTPITPITPTAPADAPTTISGGTSTATVSGAPTPLTKPGTAPASSAEADPVYQPGQGPVTLRPPGHKPDASADATPAAAVSPAPAAAPTAAPTPPSLPTGRNSGTESPATEVASVPTPGAKPDFGKAAAPVAPAPASAAAPTPPVKPADSKDSKAAESKTAEANPDAAPPPRGGTRFLWPVKGRLISSYGPKPDGLHNDGLNIAAAKGTPVVAADNGIVAYAGNELRGFGNLLLVKHADGWITAYAHLDRIEVERGATVKRGQTIGRVGQTGSVTSPQLHFELRKGSQAVDPSGQMDRKPPVSEGAFRDGPPGPG